MRTVRVSSSLRLGPLHAITIFIITDGVAFFMPHHMMDII